MICFYRKSIFQGLPWVIVPYVIVAILIGLLVGCGTVIPATNQNTQVVAFDGSEQNGGVVAVLMDLSGIITQNAYLKYNALIEKYGQRPEFVPPLKKDDGIKRVIVGKNEKPLFQIDAEHLVAFQRMNRWNTLNAPTK